MRDTIRAVSRNQIRYRPAAPERPAGRGIHDSHRFKIGQTLMNQAVHNRVKGGPCEVVRLMPLEGSEPGYQIKRAGEPYQRVVGESELRAT
jgi:hypothetical protein